MFIVFMLKPHDKTIKFHLGLPLAVIPKFQGQGEPGAILNLPRKNLRYCIMSYAIIRSIK